MNAAQKKRCRILLVDDDPIVRGALARLLALEFDVTEAANLDSARGELAAAPPDVLVTDLDLGGGQRGEELLAEVRERHPATLRVVFSGSSLTELGDAAHLALQKGSSTDAILDALRACCAPV